MQRAQLAAAAQGPCSAPMARRMPACSSAHCLQNCGQEGMEEGGEGGGEDEDRRHAGGTAASG